MSRGADNARWYRPAGSLGDEAGGVEVRVDDEIDGWEHTGLIVVTVEESTSHSHRLDHRESVVVPLSGGVTVDVDGEVFELRGRPGVFAGPTDVLYAPPGSTVTLTAPGPGPSRVALCLARVPVGAEAHPVRQLAAEDVPVELRGAGTASRMVRNFGVPGVLDASRIIACEVITPAGNWSSWPPHKHDEERRGVETELEEIYYFETRSTSNRGPDPVGYQRVYGTQERPIDVLAEVRSGDVVLVPHGWHGPAMAAPDADLYYLNVMAGPGAERAWLICDDPAHGWVREEWTDLPVDPRLTE
ncbi:MAG: 5-deoxy-glucuronate isomerase [Intrasporangiaceae bacterium]|nr:5-deoxy-glucuronate isomerase [Intrasporangiaceae bacterium]